MCDAWLRHSAWKRSDYGSVCAWLCTATNCPFDPMNLSLVLMAELLNLLVCKKNELILLFFFFFFTFTSAQVNNWECNWFLMTIVCVIILFYFLKAWTNLMWKSTTFSRCVVAAHPCARSDGNRQRLHGSTPACPGVAASASLLR